MNGLKFNNKHSFNDFGLYMESKSIQPPSKKKIKVDIPFMHGSYDFSTVGSNGEITYTERIITVSFGFSKRNKQLLYVQYSKILEWLEDVGKCELIFDDIKDYYFIGEVEDMPTFQEITRVGKLTVKFICDPFKTSITIEGNNLWDTFSFETGIMQNCKFNIVGSETISIVNGGRLVCPIINSTSNMTVIKDNITYNLVTGNNKLYDFKLKNGVNSMIVNGVGSVEIIFRMVIL